MKAHHSNLRPQGWLRQSMFLCASTAIAAVSLRAEVISLTPAVINNNDSATTSFTDGDITLTPLQAGNPASFNGNPDRLGIDDFGTNVNAFNDPDTDPNNGNEEQLRIEFTATSGLTQLSWDFSRADGPGPNDGVIISGFLSDPGATLAGGTAVDASSVSYSNGSLNLQLSGADFGNPDGFLNLAVPAASAGQTLLITVTDTTQAGAQLAVTGISYENDLAVSAPVIATGLDATYAPPVDTTQNFLVTLDPGAFPAPEYLWEFDDGSGFVTVGTDPTYGFLAGSATDGTYRVTVSNSQGSDSSTTVVTSTDDGDGINNQWELDNFGDINLYDADSDVEPDGFTNAQEFAAATDPNVSDTDGDGLEDGAEGTAGSNPLVVDSDDDGYSDGYEVNTASTDPTDVNSTPGVDDNRNSIGITFASTRGLNPNVNLPTSALAGAPGYSQKNWNVTGSLGNVQMVTEADIVAPAAGVLSDSTGAATTATFEINCTSTWSVPFNNDTSLSGLLSGYLHLTQANAIATLDLGNIPYDRYDVVVYPIAQANNGRAYLAEVDPVTFLPNTEYDFTVPARTPLTETPPYNRSADRSNLSSGLNENFPSATHVIFRGLTADEVAIDLSYVADNVGYAAIQIVEDLDSDGDGMGDNYEASVGLDPADDGTTDPVKQGAAGDFDGDGIDNITEHDNGTDPTKADTDGDGYDDDVESDTGTFAGAGNTGTDPLIVDTDGDGVPDGAETNTGTFVDVKNAGTNPLGNEDSDFDGYIDSYEILNGPTNPFNSDSPGASGAEGFAIAFNGTAGAGPNVEFGEFVPAGVPAVSQQNWNRTIDQANNQAASTGGISNIANPLASNLVDSSGTVIGNGTTGVTLSYSAAGTFTFLGDAQTPYGRLYNSFIFGQSAGNPDTTVTLGNIPYSSYDAYVYFGSETNGRRGTVSSTAAGTTYSFTTAAAQVIRPVENAYLETTDTGTGFPQANYAAFRGQTSPTFDVRTTVGAGQNSLGIFGVQIVSTGEAGAELLLTNPARTGSVFTADFTTSSAGTFQLERSTTLQGAWTPVGTAFSASAGTSQVSDANSPAGKAFYRVVQQ